MKYFYFLNFILLSTILFINTANADNYSSKLKSIIEKSINKQSQSSDRLTMRNLVNWPDSCEKTFNAPTSGLKFFPQSDNLFIAQVICTYGSYQGMSVFYKLDLSNKKPVAHLLNFPVYNSNMKITSESEIWGNVLTTSTYNKFAILNLYSGYGHCGSMTEYDVSGEQPRISQLKIQPNCETKDKIREPAKWQEIKLNDK